MCHSDVAAPHSGERVKCPRNFGVEMRACKSCGGPIVDRMEKAKLCSICLKRNTETAQNNWNAKNIDRIAEKRAIWVANNINRIKGYIARKPPDTPETRAKARAKTKAWSEKNPLCDSYVRCTLKLTKETCTPELIEIKRESILLARAIKELNKTLKEHNGN